MLNLLSDSAIFEDIIADFSEHFFKIISSIPDGHFSQINEVDTINLDTVVKKRQGLFCNVFSTKNTAKIQFPGNVINGPDYIEEGLYYINNSEEFTVRSVSNSLSDREKLVLVHPLIREGLLTIVCSSVD